MSTLGCNAEEIGTFGAHPGHDGHILGTLSAIQILVIQDALGRANIDRIVDCEPLIASLSHIFTDPALISTLL